MLSNRRLSFCLFLATVVIARMETAPDLVLTWIDVVVLAHTCSRYKFYATRLALGRRASNLGRRTSGAGRRTQSPLY